jgi:hypothetical protein
MEIQATRADYTETATSEDGNYAFIHFTLPEGQRHVLGMPTKQLPSLVHAAACAYTLNRKLIGENAGRIPAFVVHNCEVERHTSTDGWVLTLTIGGGAKLSFHIDRDRLDQMVETAQAAIGSLAIKIPKILN